MRTFTIWMLRYCIASGLFFLWLPAAGFYKPVVVSPIADATFNAGTVAINLLILRFIRTIPARKGEINGLASR